MSQANFDPETAENERLAFASAREEILKRVELRDRMVVMSFSISMAILGGTMVSRDPMIGLLVPVFNLGSTLVVCQHTLAIHYLCCWTRREISFPHWARSRELGELHDTAITARAMAQAAIFFTPAFVAIAYGYRSAFAQTSVLLSGFWWAGILMLITTCYVQWKTLVSVLAINRATGYESPGTARPPRPEPAPTEKNSLRRAS
jgi:hypothetical protein